MIFGKVMWMARATTTVVGLAIMLALVFGVATTAIGATGGNFILGKANGATTVSKLTASVAGPALTLVNNSTEAAATALNISVASGKPPLKVNAAAGTATNLSADKLDGLNSSHFAQATTDGSAVHAVSADTAAHADSADSASSATHTESADNADQLDGKDSSDFVQNSGMTTYTVFGPWISGDPSVVKAQQYFHTTHFTNTGSSGHRYIQLNPSLPSSLYGKSMLLTGVELCYNTSQEGVALGEVRLNVYSSTEPGSASGNHVTLDRSAPDGAFCRMFSGTPLLMKTNSYATLQAGVDWSAQTTFYIQRATFFLEPSNTAAAAPQ